ncbi:hypothetical protein SH2C18_09580 [Clostridium sediminicola]|uniref:hypothetical protein n=1 Tax=Clostridium sediminicola TaxID=3114879 RepID=UPI0031F220DF
MDLKIKVNMPEDKERFKTLASKTLSKILVKKLKPIEVEKFIEVLKEDIFKED